jgi:uncharacterized protein
VLELRPSFGHCNKALPSQAADARICSFESSCGTACVEQAFGNVCPNCGGGFAASGAPGARLRINIAHQ